MRFLLSASLLLALCLSARAQTEATQETSDEFAFNFNTATTKNKLTGKNVTESEFGNSRVLLDGRHVAFDKAVSGPNGFLKSENITFINKEGKELAQLNSAFMADGKLKSQTLAAKGKPARPLTWYKTKSQSPDILVPNSVVRVQYSLQNGFLKQRVLIFSLPDQTRKFVAAYDSKGRRIQDSSVHDGENMKLSYSYGPSGMTRLINAANKTDSERDISLSYLKNGDFEGMVMKEAGVIRSRIRMNYNTAGLVTGQRMESYEDGLLVNAMTMNDEAKIGIQDEYDQSGKFIVKRTAYSVDKTQILLYEEERNNGKVSMRVDYAIDGRPVKRTIYNADGTVKSSENPSENTIQQTQ